MQKKKIAKSLIFLSLLILASEGVFAESLFQAGISRGVYSMQPKPLFSTVRAKTIGDVITVIINEDASIQNNVKLDVNDSSTLTDNFSSIINTMLSSARKGIRVDIPDVNGYGGGSKTKNTAAAERTIKLQDTMTTQVVQVLPNGNLVVQGKKVAINAGEKTQIILSGIVDPRFITNAGTIQSNNIANLQIAIIGNGTVSRHDSENIVNRIFSYLF